MIFDHKYRLFDVIKRLVDMDRGKENLRSEVEL